MPGDEPQPGVSGPQPEGNVQKPPLPRMPDFGRHEFPHYVPQPLEELPSLPPGIEIPPPGPASPPNPTTDLPHNS